MNADRLLALYEQVAEAPDAIARLRRLVLDLAIRGKLIAQNPTDEPASEQLKRIATARRTFPSTGRIRNTKVADPSLTDVSFPLADGWAQVSLAELVRVLNGRAYKKTELLDTGTPVLRVGNLFTSDHWYYSNLELEDDKYCDKGDLIYSWSASFGPFIWDGSKVIFHYHIWKLPLFSETDLEKQFLYLFLLQKTREIKDAGRGISMVHMTKEKMEQLAVPLPPLAEQRRIVAKVEGLMALLDQLEAARTTREATRDRLTTASLTRLTAPDTEPEDFPSHAHFALDSLPAITARADQVKALRQTILNLAVRGKLVEQDVTDEPASELLKKIADAKSIENGKRGSRARGLPKSTVPLGYDLPSGWVVTLLGDVALSMRYGTSTKCAYDQDLVPVLRIPNVSSGQVILDDLKYGPLSVVEQEALALTAGDLLMIRSNGSLDIVGRAAVVSPDAEGMAFAGYLVRLQTLKDLIDTRYIWLALNSTEVRHQIERPIRSAVGLKNVNLAEFSNLSFWLPPLTEQHRIVARVDALMALCDRLEVALGAADSTRAKLLEALLHEALSGSQEGAVIKAAE